MNLDRKLKLDRYLGLTLSFLIRPLVALTGRILGIDHSTTPRGKIVVMKMLGGGSLLLAYPSLLALRRKYPALKMTLVTTPAVKKFGELMGIFDEYCVIEDESFIQMLGSSLKALKRIFRADTFLDLEVYSHLASLFSLCSLARNRMGFYLESALHRRHLSTHLIFFNRFSGVGNFYDALADSLGAQKISPELCYAHFLAHLDLSMAAKQSDTLAVGAFVSELGKERELSEDYWVELLGKAEGFSEVFFLGARADAERTDKIIAKLKENYPTLKAQNLCGALSLRDSVRKLAGCGEFWGVDSALLHIARLLRVPSLSIWGPTDPATRLVPIEGYKEVVIYKKLPCSPCIHIVDQIPCRGNNLCIQQYAKPLPEGKTVYWSESS